VGKTIGVTAAFALTALAGWPGPAQADGIGDVDAGDKEIVATGIWILGHQDQDSTGSATQISVFGTAGFRYFVIDNLGVGVLGSAFYKTAGGDADDSGFIVRLDGSYFLSLSDNLYLAPGLGLGASFGSRTVPVAPGMNAEADILGFTATFSVPFVLYTPGPFNVRAGPTLITTFGSASFADDDESFTTVDGGFEIGVGFGF
jgi:hypothetical protein